MRILTKRVNALDVLDNGTQAQPVGDHHHNEQVFATTGGDVHISTVNWDRCERRNYGRYAKFLIRQDVNSVISNMVITGAGALSESINENAELIFYNLSKRGYCYFTFDGERIRIVGDRQSVSGEEVYRIDEFGIGKNGLTRDACADDIIAFIDDCENAENTLVNQAEASDIFTPKEFVGKLRGDTIVQRFKQMFGIKRGQTRTAFVDVPLEHHTLGRYDYQLTEKIKFQFQKLCKLYMYPEDLYFANTTYDNKAAARFQLCMNYAGYFYSVIQRIISQIITAHKINDFNIDFWNIQEWEDAKQKRIENTRAELDYLENLKTRGYDVTQRIETLIANI